MPVPIAAAAGFGIWKAVAWIGCALAGAWATNKAVKAFGSTPANDLAKVPDMENRVKPQQLYNDAKKHKKDKINYHKERGKKARSELDKINKQIEELKEEKTNLAKQLKQAKDDGDTKKEAAVTAQLKGVDDKISGLENKYNDKKDEIKESEKTIDEIYDDLGDPYSMTEEQYVAKSNSVNWTSYKNWGIIAICVVIFFMLIGFIKKLFASLLGSLK